MNRRFLLGGAIAALSSTQVAAFGSSVPKAPKFLHELPEVDIDGGATFNSAIWHAIEATTEVNVWSITHHEKRRLGQGYAFSDVEKHYEALLVTAGWTPIKRFKSYMGKGELGLGYARDGKVFLVVGVTPEFYTRIAPIGIMHNISIF